jgi:N12 class adenine-specific DNA methylase
VGGAGDGGGLEADSPTGPGAQTRDVQPVGEWRARSAGDLAPAGDRHRLAANIEALEVLRALHDERRPPTRSEQDRLARWSAWGSLPKVFDEGATEFAEARERLRELLDPDQWRAAARTTLSAHYTDYDVATAMWGFVLDSGFAAGRVLEPGVGSGTFLATVPDGVVVEAVGVELDPVTARVAQALHPDATVRPESFALTRYPDGWFDLTIGNVPFGDYKLFDPIYNRSNLSIHNHFLAKSLRLTRPGGYVAVLTSRFTLDAGSLAARREIAELGDLVGAVRLPEGTMRRVAGTDVAMDLVVLRRREPGTEPRGEAWLGVATVQTPDGPVQVNEYFARHPPRVLGELRAQHGQYGQDDVEVRPHPGPLAPRLTAALHDIVVEAAAAGLVLSTRELATARDPEGETVVDADIGPHHVERSLLLAATGAFAKVSGGVPVAYQPPARQAGELANLIELRDAYFELIDAQAVSSDDSTWQGTRARLNDRYDRYVRLYGPLGRYREVDTGRRDEEGQPVRRRLRPAMGGFRDDPGLPSLWSLEHFDDATQSATKAAVFERRLLAPRHVPTAVEHPEDALAVCLDQRGEVDVAAIGALLGCDQAEARRRLGTLVFDDPGGGQALPAAQYLSGNVRARLAEAKAAAEADPRWLANVTALEAVQPRDLEPAEIEVRLGAPWLPPADVAAFCAEVLEAPVHVEYAAATGEWAVKPTGGRWSVVLTSDWGTARADGIRLVELAANQRVVTVTDEGPNGERVVNLAETLSAREKQELLAERFSKWAWEDPQRSARLAEEYNRRFNSTVLPSYDGGHLSLPGLAEDFRPHPHQRDAVWRMLSEETVLLAHDVGAGKTATMVMGGHELKRLGIIRRPLYVVPNHMLEQFSREYLQLYPAAKVLVGDKDDVNPAERNAFVARCAAEDWDAVIITQSSFERIPVSAGTERGFVEARIEDLRESLAQSRADKGLTVKHLERLLASAEQKHQALITDARRDQGGVNFESAGIDYLIIDEAHAYKNLAITSHIQGVGGPGSKRATDLEMKMGWLRGTHGGRVATFATATPISNSISEMYVMQRYLQPGVLEAAGVRHFDGWAANFGRTVTALELAPDASSYRMNTRFARFTNVPDLLRMFRQAADVRTRDQLGLKLPAIVGDKAETVVVASSDELRAYVRSLAERAELVRNRAVRPEEDNMLKVSGDGRRAALDVRLVGLPAGADGGKVAAAADRIALIYERNAANTYAGPNGGLSVRPGALQLVFCDLGTPHDDGRWTVYDQLRAELISRGVPATEVRFMHEARNDAEKARLFAAARSGSVSVLIGSTEKMGVGTNVQDRAVALHHIDCPWRPADLEQRDGRVLRQGNQNAEVEIVRYVTEGSFDVFSWQTVERKAAFIDQVMRGDVTERTVDDIGDQALSYAEVKALATGNPLIMERAGVESELTKLQRLYTAYRDDQARLAQRVRGSEHHASEQMGLVAAYQAAATRALDISGDRFAIVLGGRSFAKRADAAAALRQALLAEMDRAPHGLGHAVRLGDLAGFSVVATLSRDALEVNARIELDGVPRSTIFKREEVRDNSPLGILARVENLSTGLSDRANQAGRNAEESGREAAKAAARIGQPFEHVGRIEALRHRLAHIDAQLAAPEGPDGARLGASAAGGAGPAVVGPLRSDDISLASVLDASFPADVASALRSLPVTETVPAQSFVGDPEVGAQVER